MDKKTKIIAMKEKHFLDSLLAIERKKLVTLISILLQNRTLHLLIDAVKEK